jgi:hypothetical protein
MAIIITYPTATPTGGSLLLGSVYDPELGTSATKNFSVSALVTYTMGNGFKSLPVYANNAAAIVGGLDAGDVYRTSVGVLMVTY